MIQKNEPALKNAWRAHILKKCPYVRNFKLCLIDYLNCYSCFLNNYFSYVLVIEACDPNLMPTFPHHRNIKNSSAHTQQQSSSKDSLPAISDLLGSLIKKKRYQ